MSHPTSDRDQSRRRMLASALGILVLLAVLALTWWIDGQSTTDADSPTSSSTSSASTFDGGAAHGAHGSRAESDLPARVARTLSYIDSNDWPEAANAPGTRGGDTFRNNERRLPQHGSDGTKVRYREWDVNPKQDGRGRDAERIVTGDDGSAYYTLDHYESFTRIRGPSS
ncbi:ribonuclease domain-containing protein [Gordonia zhaorongruii]|uniref:ribonuclease domain-containing protein n=1 Tax=Gordonia zhaorongruii TaxID=2597659 RepID=UPI00104A0113|nr:ribonuclease domain-containing protein [Gordonia zhaorongruii]